MTIATYTDRTWQTEFADYDPATMPPLPAHWEDIAWHNELCPGFICYRAHPDSERDSLLVWIDYEDRKGTETEECERFGLHRLDDVGTPVEDILHTDDWQAVLATIAAYAANGSKADSLDAVGTAIRHGFTFSEIGRMASAFAANLAKALTPEQFAEMRDLNRAQIMPDVCHSHDFCDANMPMLDAFTLVMGRETDPQKESDCAIWGAAWHVAKVEFLTATDPEELALKVLERFQFGTDVGGGGATFLSRYFGEYGQPQWHIWATRTDGGQSMPTAEDFWFCAYSPTWDGEEPDFQISSGEGKTLAEAAAAAVQFVGSRLDLAEVVQTAV